MSVQVTSTTRTADEMRSAFGIATPESTPESASAPTETTFSQTVDVTGDATPAPAADAAPAPGAAPAPEPDREPAPADAPPAPQAEGDHADDEPDQEPPKPADEPRKVSRSQQRVNEALREKYLAEERARQLQAELDALKTGTPSTPKAPANDAPSPATVTEGDPEPSEDDFTDWSEYQLERAKWAGRQEARRVIAEERQKDAETRAAAEARAAREQAFLAYQDRAAAAREVYKDFDTVVGQDIPLDDAGIMQRVIVTSEVGPDLAYYLGQHPEECARLSVADPNTILTQLHRLEGRFEAQREARVVAPARPVSRLPSAPPPPPSVRVGTSVQVPTTRTARSFAEFEEAERREREARARTR